MAVHRWRRTVVLVTAAAVFASACGSTVGGAAGRAEPEGLGDNTIADTALADPGTESASGRGVGDDRSVANEAAGSGRRTEVGPAGNDSAPEPQLGPASGGGTGGTRRGRLPVGPGVHGVTDTTIQVGMATSDATAAAAGWAAVAGGDGEAIYDSEAASKAAVDLVNATGGIAGRRVEPVYYFVNAANLFSPSGREREAQAACAHWTEDNHVFAFHAAGMTEEVILECAAKTRTPMMAFDYHAYPSQERFESMADYWYGPYHFVADRRERALARFLVAHRFFDGGAKIGIMTEDKPGIRDGVERGLKPTLLEAGLTPAIEIRYPDPIESPWANYVLQLQMADVTHVLFSATTLSISSSLFMMRAAEDQGYRPRWGLGSDHFPIVLAAADTPPEQLENVSGMGWAPFHDIGATEPQGPNGRACEEANRKAGNEDVNYGYGRCEFLFFLQAAFERAEVVSPAGLAAGVGRLADSYLSTRTIGGATRFRPGRHDGAAIVRLVRYDPSAQQFKYTASPEAVPQ